MGITGAEEQGVRNRGPARVHETIGTGEITHFLDSGSKADLLPFDTTNESPFPETTLQYGMQWQAGLGNTTWMRCTNGTPNTTTHGYIIPWDFSVKWVTCRVVPVPGVQFTYELRLYNNGSLIRTISLTNSQIEAVFSDIEMDKGNLSIIVSVTAVSPGISAFTNPIITVGVRRRF